MTSAVPDAVRDFFRSNSYAEIATSTGVALIAVLLLVLIEVEMVRVLGGPGVRVRLRLLAVATVPLLMTFAVLIAARLAEIIA